MTQQKNLIYILIIVFVVLVAIWGYRKAFVDKTNIPEPTQERTSFDRAEEAGINTFTLSGIIEKIDGQKVYLKSGYVENTGQGNEYVEKDLVIIYNSRTLFFFHDFNTVAPTSELKVGARIAIYTTENPLSKEEVLVDKILIKK